jgi:hypothetical protein
MYIYIYVHIYMYINIDIRIHKYYEGVQESSMIPLLMEIQKWRPLYIHDKALLRSGTASKILSKYGLAECTVTAIIDQEELSDEDEDPEKGAGTGAAPFLGEKGVGVGGFRSTSSRFGAGKDVVRGNSFRAGGTNVSSSKVKDMQRPPRNDSESSRDSDRRDLDRPGPRPRPPTAAVVPKVIGLGLGGGEESIGESRSKRSDRKVIIYVYIYMYIYTCLYTVYLYC